MAEPRKRSRNRATTNVLKGERIDRIKDRLGKRLTDAYLVEVRAADYPWLPAVYSNLSGYVHFSGSHITSSIDALEDDGHVQFEISGRDLKFPEFSWVELLNCFREATSILAKYLHGCRLTKSMSPEELVAGRREG